jgi:hypothetical protein
MSKETLQNELKAANSEIERLEKVFAEGSLSFEDNAKLQGLKARAHEIKEALASE